MRLLTSSLYVLLFYVAPGELLLVALSRLLPMPAWLGLVILNLAAYAALWLSLRLGGVAFDDLAPANEGMSKHLRETLDDRGLRWLGVTGCAVLGAGVVFLALANQVPLPFWFLYAAIAAGLTERFQIETPDQAGNSLSPPRCDRAKTEPVPSTGEPNSRRFRNQRKGRTSNRATPRLTPRGDYGPIGEDQSER